MYKIFRKEIGNKEKEHIIKEINYFMGAGMGYKTEPASEYNGKPDFK